MENVNWKPEVLVEGEWGQNSMVFATEQEAKAYAKDLYQRWYATSGHRAVPVDAATNPVNYKIVDGEMFRVENG